MLRNGKVLLVGGESNDGAINSLEIYDIETGTWIKGSPLPRPTFEQIANLIGGDLLMIAGGHDGQNPLASTLIYDSKTDVWTYLPDMSVPRTKHVSTVLSDDRIFVHGGFNNSGILAHAEIYEPGSKQWISSNSSFLPRIGHSVTTLDDGKVLILGGHLSEEALGEQTEDLCQSFVRDIYAVTPDEEYDCEDGWLATEIYDPSTDTSKISTPLIIPRWKHTATLLGDGTVLVVGGTNNSSSVLEAEIFDPSTETWTDAGPMFHPRSGHTASLLSDDRVLISGGFTYVPISYSEIYDVKQGWINTENLMGPRHMHSAVSLGDGEVLGIGGRAGLFTNLTRTELYDSDAGSWTRRGKMPIALWDHNVIPVDCSKVVLVGGKKSDGSPLELTYFFEPSTGRYQPGAKLNKPRFGHSATGMVGGLVVIAGGSTAGLLLSDSVEILNPSNMDQDVWTMAEPMPAPVERHAAIDLGNGNLLITGGWDGSKAMDHIWDFDVNENMWNAISHLGEPRWGHSMVLLDDDTVLISGGVGRDGFPITSVEKYDLKDSSIKVTDSMKEARVSHHLLKDANGDVYAIGGYGLDGISLSSAEHYQVNLNKWNKLPDMSEKRAKHTAIILRNQNILVTGGTQDHNIPSGTAELFDVQAGTWSSAGSMREARMGHTSYQYDDNLGIDCIESESSNKVFIMGGYGLSAMNSVEVYIPDGGGWSAFETIVRGFLDVNIIRLAKEISQIWSH